MTYFFLNSSLLILIVNACKTSLNLIDMILKYDSYLYIHIISLSKKTKQKQKQTNKSSDAGNAV